MLNKNGKLFGLINIIDFSVIAVIILFGMGIFLVKTGAHKTSAQVIKRKTPIEFDVFSRGQKVLDPDKLFKGQKKSYLTIRNVPYNALDIVKYECKPWQIAVLHPENNTAVSINDPSAPYTYDCLVTLKDNAEITDDGPVIGGNKIKIGLRVDIEGFNYRFPGAVSDIRIMDK